MIWQDIVMMVCIFGLVPSTLLMVFSRRKPSKLVCSLMAVFLSGISVCFFTLKLYMSFIPETITAILWVVLLIQRRKQ